MALVECVECGREVSDRAAACPGCGCPIAPAETTREVIAPSSAACRTCGHFDKTQSAGSVLLEEQMTIATDGLMDLKIDGRISTVDHGRFQQMFGSGWILGTRDFRTGSVSSVDLNAGGTTSTMGTQVSELASVWTATMPDPRLLGAEYRLGLERFESMVYCRRCARFNVGDSSATIEHAVLHAFGILPVVASALLAWSAPIRSPFGQEVWRTEMFHHVYRPPESISGSTGRAAHQLREMLARSFGAREISSKRLSVPGYSVAISEFGVATNVPAKSVTHDGQFRLPFRLLIADVSEPEEEALVAVFGFAFKAGNMHRATVDRFGSSTAQTVLRRLPPVLDGGDATPWDERLLNDSAEAILRKKYKRKKSRAEARMEVWHKLQREGRLPK